MEVKRWDCCGQDSNMYSGDAAGELSFAVLAGWQPGVSDVGLALRGPAGSPSFFQRLFPPGSRCHAKPPAANRPKWKIGKAVGHERIIPSLSLLAVSCDHHSPPRMGGAGDPRPPHAAKDILYESIVGGQATRCFQARRPEPCLGPCARAQGCARDRVLARLGPRTPQCHAEPQQYVKPRSRWPVALMVSCGQLLLPGTEPSGSLAIAHVTVGPALAGHRVVLAW